MRMKHSWILSLLPVGLLLLSGCSLPGDGSDWPMWRYDAARSAASPYSIPDDLELFWVRDYPKLEPTWDDPLNRDLMQFDRVYEPVVHRGSLFIVSNAGDCLISLDAETGKERWRSYVNGPVRLPAAAAEGRVYITSDDGYLYCIDADTGRRVWEFRGAPRERIILGNQRLISTWPARGGPVVRNGRVYFAAGIWPFMGIFIYALDAETGEILWKNDSSGPRYMLQPHNSPAYAGVAPQGQLVISGNRLLVPCGRSVPAAFDLHTGKFLYYRLAENGKTGGAFTAAVDGRYFVNYHRDSVVSLYRLSDGESLIRRFGRMPVLTPNRIFSRGDAITAWDLARIRQAAVEERLVFDQKTGSVETVKEEKWVFDPVWQVEVDASGDLIQAGSHLYAGGDGVVSAVSIPGWFQDAEVTWQAKIEGKADRLVAADEKLFVVTDAGRIYAFGEGPVDRIRYHTPAPLDDSIQPMADARARSILKSTGIREGYCLIYGDGKDLAEALLRTSDLRIVVVESDPDRVEELRKRFDTAGLYGKRLSVVYVSSASVLPSYLASLIVVEDVSVLEDGKADQFFREIFRQLRPYGGTAYIPISGTAAQSLGEKLKAIRLESAVVRNVEFAPDLVEGIRSAGEQIPAEEAGDDLLAELAKASSLLLAEGHLLLIREGRLPGSGDWTHQYGSIANTVKSDDQLVKLPLGILWFGGSPNTDVLPRHGHGPPEQVIGGRLFIEGMKSLSARDVYTGRVLWKREFSRLNTHGIYYDDTYQDTPLDTSYNQVHIPGANARGTNFVATSDRVYLLLERSCVVLDPATGRTLDEFSLPPETAGGEPPEWAYIGVYGDYLIGGAEFASNLQYLELDELDPRMKTRLNSFYNFDITSSRKLVVMDRYTGKVLWSRRARLGFLHNAITAADGILFCIDRLAPAVTAALHQRPGGYRLPPAQLTARRIRDGRLLWSTTENVFGTWLSFSEQHGILIQAGRSSRDMLRGEPRGLAAHRPRDGSVIWKSDIADGGPYILHGDTIITESTAYNLFTGEQKMRIDPLTGEETPWVFRRDYGCNYVIASENLLTFRSAAAGFLDLLNDSGTGTFGGFRSSCTSNLIAANGVLNAPDYTRTCSCSYQNQTSLALIHMPEVDLWTTFYSQPKSVSLAESKTAVLITDTDSNLTFGNPALRQLFGWEEDFEIRETSLEQLIADPGDLQRVLEGLQNRRSWMGTVHIRTAEGERREVHLSARVLYDKSFSQLVRVFLFEESADGAVAFMDREGKLTYVDETFLEMWKLGDEEEVLGEPIEHFLRETKDAAESRRRGQDWSGLLTAVLDDDSTREVHVISRAVSDSGGMPVSFAVTCFDVTERKKIEAEAGRLVKELGSGADLRYFLSRRKPILRVGINFGAPGDRRAGNGTLWLEWPPNEGPSPEIQLEMLPVEARIYTHDPSWVKAGGFDWITASGALGVSEINLRLADEVEEDETPPERSYCVSLYFAEPEDLKPGDRRFDVEIQGQTILKGFDIAREAGGSGKTVVRTFPGIRVADQLKIRLIPAQDTRIAEPLVCGLEVATEP